MSRLPWIILASIVWAAACGYCGNCFPAGTLVETPSGPVAIETLKVGDQVVSYDEGSGANVVGAVVETYVHEGEKTLLTLHFADGTSVQATPDHPFYVQAEHLWHRAADLAAGMQLIRYVGGMTALASVDSAENHQPVYNIKVSGGGGFFAGGVLAKYYE